MKNIGLGIPTDIDVHRLQETIGVPQPGDTISYHQIDKVLGLDRSQHRWKTVVNAWRRKLDREHNIILKARSNQGYVALDGAGRADYCGRVYKGGLRRIVRASVVATRTDRLGLNYEDVRVLDHISSTGAALRLAAATAARQIKYEAKQE
jgi:hypothetical protein